jgi:transketolase
MRTAFVKSLFKKAKKNKNIMLLTGDLGYSVFEEFMQTLPNQYINAGIAEQNMTGVAAGMAMEDKIPFIYSIVPFVTMRNFEQIRNDICYQNLNVKVVGVGAGFSYGTYGHTHHGLEDIGILRTLPNITILAPGDPMETAFAVEAALKINGPVYIRLGRAGEPMVHSKKPVLHVGKGFLLQEGRDITVIGTSTMLYTTQQVVKMLSEKNISVRFISMHTIKPLDKEIIIESAKKTKAIFTIEEHSLIGGLGSAVAEVLAEENTAVRFKRFAVPDRFTKTMGLRVHMLRANNLLPEQIVRDILAHI